MMRGGMNMGNMMKQMQKMQKDVKKAQDELNVTEFVGNSSQDYVVATFTGDKVLKDLTIKPEVIDADDPDMLQDLIVAAVNDGLNKVNQATEQKLGKYTQGLM